MKKYLKALLLLLLLQSCKKTAEQPVVAYPDIVVGTLQNGSYTVTNVKEIQQEWEKAILHTGTGIKKLESFTIVKGKTQGDAVNDFYMLSARTTDGKTTMAALLVQKEHNFYFDKINPVSVICTGECTNGCLPAALLKNGTVYLICGACASCVKTDVSLNFPE